MLRPLLNALEVLAAAALISIEAGLGGGSPQATLILYGSDLVVLGAFGGRMALEVISEWRTRRRPWSIVAVVAVVGLSLVSVRIGAGVALLRDGLVLGASLRRHIAANGVIHDIGLRPARSLVLSFAALIGLGTVLLSLPAAWGNGPVGVVDALFTAVSATCVTGLITVDTATAWSPFGKGVIFALFQLGGLGIMVVSSALTLAFGQSLGARRGEQLRDVFDEVDAEELRRLLKTVIYGTFLIEAIGAAVLFVRFAADMPVAEAATQAIFHSVSAFCNAGFSLFSDSLVRYAGDSVVNVTIMLLFTLGGFGFAVLVALRRYIMSLGRAPLPVHAKLVLTTSVVLLWLGALFYFFFEYDRSLGPLSLGDKILAALFQSASTRTAGFNTVPLDVLHPVTMLVMILLMFIGASSGSTGGGIKTTTFALVILAARALLLERQDVEIFGRRIAQAQVLRAMALTGGAAVSLALGFGALLVTERWTFQGLAFEAASALGTVGLSTGATSHLSAAGRLIVCMLMFFGRVGTLTAVAALAARRPASAGITLPEGKVFVG